MSIGEFRKHLIQHRKQREIGKFDAKKTRCLKCQKDINWKYLAKHKEWCNGCIIHYCKKCCKQYLERIHLIEHHCHTKEMGDSQNESHLPSSTCTDSEFTGHLMGTCKSINLKISQKDIKSFLWKTHKEFYDTFNINFCPRPECRSNTFLTFDDQFNHIYYKHLEAGQKFKNT